MRGEACVDATESKEMLGFGVQSRFTVKSAMDGSEVMSNRVS
jgi:hypothetical protein